jgi:hypothetical protein
LEDLFKGFFQGTEGKLFYSVLWKYLLALSGPDVNITFVKDMVKDSMCITVDNCLLRILFDKIVFRVFIKIVNLDLDLNQLRLGSGHFP